jgi:hypothetical protein
VSKRAKLAAAFRRHMGTTIVGSPTGTSMPTQPDFLFIIRDQLRADHPGCNGNPVCIHKRACLKAGRMASGLPSIKDYIPLHLEATTFVTVIAAHD